MFCIFVLKISLMTPTVWMTIVVIRASIRISAVTSCIVCPVLHHVPGVVLRYNIFMFLHVWCRICGPSGPGHLGYIAYTHCCPGHGVVTLMLSGDQHFLTDWLGSGSGGLLSYPCCSVSSETSCWSTTPQPGYTVWQWAQHSWSTTPQLPHVGISCNINTMDHGRAAEMSNVPH